MTPDQAVRLLSVTDWPPRLEHWPPKDKSTWQPGMMLVGRIEATMTLPRPDGSKKRGEPYLALYVRRESDQRLVMFHGWHTAAEDLDGMRPAPGLLFAAVYRGQGTNDFEDFKYLVTPYDPPGSQQQARADTGQASTATPPARAPEGGATSTSPTPPSGTTQPADVPPGFDRVTSKALAKAFVHGQSAAWREAYQQTARQWRDSGRLAELVGPDGIETERALILETHRRVSQAEESTTAPRPDSVVDLNRYTNVEQVKDHIRRQSDAWQRTFQQHAERAKAKGDLNHLSTLEMWLELVRRTHADHGIAVRGRAA